MGRIKSTTIKKAARTLISENPNFTDSFEENKILLKPYTLPDKSTRNKIAGYITRFKKLENLQNK